MSQIVLNPITLPASKMLATMTTLIGEIRFNDTLAPSDIVNDLVESCRQDKVDFGKGIVYTYKEGLQPVKDLTETSSAFTITKPNIGQETLLIDNYKFIPISFAEILSKDAVLHGTAIQEFTTFVMSLTEDTYQFEFYDICNGMYQDWTPGQATQTIQIDQIDTSTLTGQDRQIAEQWNATQVAKVMRKTLNNMKVKNNKYADIATYQDANGGGSKPYLTALRYDNTKLVVNDKYWTNFLADAMASLYHSEKLGEMIPGERFVLLPEDSMKTGNEKVIGWLSDRKKFALSDFYKVLLSIVDPSTLYTNMFLHYAYGNGVFKHAPGVKFVENTITPAQVLGTTQSLNAVK